MARKQKNVGMPREWFDQLAELAYGPEKNTPSRSHLNLIRDVLKATYLRRGSVHQPKAASNRFGGIAA